MIVIINEARSIGFLVLGCFNVFYYQIGKSDFAVIFGFVSDNPEGISDAPEGTKVAADPIEDLKRHPFSSKGRLRLCSSEKKSDVIPYIAPTADYANELNRVVEQLQVPEEALDRGIDEMMAMGTLQQCLDTFERFVNLGATNINPQPLIANEESDEILSKEIIPYFKSKSS